jgi:hypothetical protein
MTRTRFLLAAFAATLALISASTADAQNKAPDGAILINQSTVLGGLAGDGFGFPITLTQPGLYRLTSNIVVPDANTTAILITANNVTLDLNGFTISGPTVCVGNPVTSCSPTGGGNGILVEDFRVLNTTVRNGNVDGMGSRAIVIWNGRIERINATNNGFAGIDIFGTGIISDSIAMRNNQSGIGAPSPGLIVNNVATENSGIGFNAGNTSGAAHNVSRNNGSDNLTPSIDLSGNLCNNGALCP